MCGFLSGDQQGGLQLSIVVGAASVCCLCSGDVDTKDLGILNLVLSKSPQGIMRVGLFSGSFCINSSMRGRIVTTRSRNKYYLLVLALTQHSSSCKLVL